MAHAHDDAGGGRAATRRSLGLVLALTGTFTVAEAVGGLLTGSLALLADAGHMLSDDLTLALALTASWLADRPSTPNRSFGYQRAEVLAALFNGATLVAISIWIFFEASGRFSDPPDVAGAGVLAIAVAGMAVNIAGVAILSRRGDSSLNVTAAMRHLLADLLGSVGVIVSALIILTTGWLLADPVVSVLIGALILIGAVPVLRDSIRVLLEGSPKNLDAAEVGNAMAATDGVTEVHDLHLWEVTSGFPALSAHVLVGPDSDCHLARLQLERLLNERFGIEHTTLQVEHSHSGELLQIEETPPPDREGGG